MFYKNVSYSDKTFYGLTFKPGEIKEVDKYINHTHMILVDAPEKNNKELPQPVQEQQKPSSDKSKKGTEKKNEPAPESKKDAKSSDTDEKPNS